MCSAFCSLSLLLYVVCLLFGVSFLCVPTCVVVCLDAVCVCFGCDYSFRCLCVYIAFVFGVKVVVLFCFMFVC